jgi:hypothetical protein
MEAVHAVLLRDYASHEAAERGTVKFLRNTIDELWYKDLKNPRTFYNSVTAMAFFDHLEDNCGGLHPSELINLPTEMISFYQKTEGIPEYINDLEDAQRKLARAKLPMSNEQLLAIASTAVLAAQHFPCATDEWEALPPAAKTWAAWKTTYRAAHIARKRQLLATGGAEPLSGAHAATDVTSDPYLRLDGYLDNLANAATQEKTTLAQLADHCTSLSASVASLTAGVASLTSAYALLANNNRPATPAPATARLPTRPNTSRAAQKFAPNGYCWSHGYKVGLHHSSGTCKAKAPGHLDAATRANTMNGSNAFKGWDN